MIRVLKAFVLAYMNMGTSYLESILGSKEAKEHSLAHCTTCLACKTCPRYFRVRGKNGTPDSLLELELEGRMELQTRLYVNVIFTYGYSVMVEGSDPIARAFDD